MSERLKVISVKTNPRKPAGRRAPKRSAKRRASSSTERRRAKAPRRQFVVEVFHEDKAGYKFLYWNGKKLVPKRDRAKKYARESIAHADAKTILAKCSGFYRFARVVPA